MWYRGVMKNIVLTYRDAGLEARWTKRDGTPFIAVRYPSATLTHQRETWWLVDKPMFDCMASIGVVKGFLRTTLLGDIFNL